MRARTFGALMIAVALGSAGAVLAQTQPPAGTKPDHMRHRFDDPARFAKSFDDPARDAWQMPNRVIQLLQLDSRTSLADIGAGTGYFSVRLARSAPAATVYAVDIEPSMVDYLKKRAASERLTNIVPVLAAASSPNLPAPVDLVLVVDTYHHLPNRVAYFRDLRKSLTPTGRVAIVDFRKDAPDGPPVHFRFTPEQIESEMKDAGFQLDAKHDFLPRQHFLVFRN
ncbi:MAG: class I SAM-dependent methyltransferase [Vicinamibacterales bacterium]